MAPFIRWILAIAGGPMIVRTRLEQKDCAAAPARPALAPMAEASGERGIFFRSPPLCAQWDGYQITSFQSPRPTILLATDSLVPSGVGEHMLTLARQLACDFDVALAAPRETGLADRATELGIAAAEFDPELPGSAQRSLAAVKPDVLHVHAGIAWEGHGLVRAGRRAGVGCIVRTEHLPFLLADDGERTDYLAAARLVDRVICVCAEGAASYLASGVPADKLAVVRNGVDKERPAAGDVRVIRGSRTGPVLLMAARFTEQKGHALLLEAWPDVLKAFPAATLLLCGEGPLLPSISQRIAAGQLASSVRLLGQRADLPALMRAADLFLLPSSFEGLPLVLLEAMAHGLPIVATDACGNREAVEHGVTGLLTPIGDTLALARAITRALGDAAWLASASRASRERHQRHFTAARMMRETLAVYRQAGLDTPQLGEVA